MGQIHPTNHAISLSAHVRGARTWGLIPLARQRPTCASVPLPHGPSPTPRPQGGRRRRRGRDAEAGSAAAARSHFIRRRLERPSAFRSIRTHGHGLLLTFLTRPVASQQSPVARRFHYAVDVRRNRRNPQIKRRKFHPCAKFKLFGRGRASTPIYCGYNGGDVRQSHHH